MAKFEAGDIVVLKGFYLTKSASRIKGVAPRIGMVLRNHESYNEYSNEYELMIALVGNSDPRMGYMIWNEKCYRKATKLEAELFKILT